MSTLPNEGPDPEEEDTDYREDLEIDDPQEEPEVREPEEPEVERQARQLGWHPKEEYLGPPHRWKTAEEFMKQGRDVLPILRDNNKRLLERADKQDQEIRSLKQSLTDQTSVLQELRDMARNARQTGYDSAVAELKTKQREAAASGDVEAYDRVSEQIEAVVQTRAEVTKPSVEPKVEPKPEAPRVAQEVVDFVNRTPLYNADRVLNLAMQAEHTRLSEDEPDLPLAQNLERAWETVKRRYPKKFGLQPTNGSTPKAAPVQQPTSQPKPSQRRGTPIEQIEDPIDRAAAKTAFTRFKRQMPDYTEEEYMAAYNNPKGDILTIRQNLREKSK